MPAHDSNAHVSKAALWESWQDLWNGNLAAAEEIIAPGFVAHLPPWAAAPARCGAPRG